MYRKNHECDTNIYIGTFNFSFQKDGPGVGSGVGLVVIGLPILGAHHMPGISWILL